jgi:hypothetical protein
MPQKDAESKNTKIMYKIDLPEKKVISVRVWNFMINRMRKAN